MDDPFDPLRLKHFVPVGSVSTFERIPGGWRLQIGNEPAEVSFVREGIVKVIVGDKTHWTHRLSPACAHPEVPPPQVEHLEEPERLELQCAGTRVLIDRISFAVDVYRADGSCVCRSLRDSRGVSLYLSRLNDEFLIQREADVVDLVYGLGEKTGCLNKRGRLYRLWNTDVLGPNADGIPREPGAGEFDPGSTIFDPYYVSIPFFYHGRETGEPDLKVSGHFIDNPCPSDFDFRAKSSYRLRFQSGPCVEYIFPGPAIRDVLREYTWLTGRIELPPLWALGFHQCRWRRYTQERVLRMGRLFREKQIPCDTLWLDIDYMDEYRVFTWEPELFPDPPGMIRDLNDLGFQVITIVDPGVKEDPAYAVYQEGAQLDAFCKTETGRTYIGQVWPGRTAFPDFTNAAVREWWGRLNADWVKSGLAGIWNDMNEPSTGEIHPGAMRFGFEGLNLSHEFGHNLYANFMAMGTVEGLRNGLPNRRTFVLSRAGYAGIQRYAANWLGDNMARWEHLAMSLPMAMNLGLSGQPFIGADVGGFAESSTGELLARWTAAAALTPFFRNHNMGHVDQYPWAFGPAVESICREQIRLRYRLLPYLYSCFVESSRTGDPIQRPMIFDFQNDRTVRLLDDQFMTGENLLVAPVLAEGQTSRHVYLPPGTWFDWNTGQQQPGGEYVAAEAPLRTLPLYVRGGAVVPLWPDAPASTHGYFPEEIELLVALPQEEGTWRSLLHEDDGVTTARNDGMFLETEFILSRKGPELTLTGAANGLGFPEFRRKHFRLTFWGAYREVTLESGASLDAQGRVLCGNDFRILLRL